MAKKSWFEIKNQGEIPELFIYDEIGIWGVSAKRFIEGVKALNTKKLTLHINSPGGDVFDGIAIYNYLKNSDIEITVKIEGIAASIASIIALCGDDIQMAENSMMMIHNPWGALWGESGDMRHMADVLDKIKEQIITSYVRKSGKDAETIDNMMSQETWLTAKEAKEFGLIDSITEEISIAAKLTNWENYFENFPKIKQPKNGGEMDPKLLKEIGVKDEAAILPFVQNLQSNIQTLTDENTRQIEQNQKLQVELDIANKKISPKQEAFALKMKKMGDEVYNEWVSQNKPTVPAGTVEIENGSNGEYTADELLNDISKFEALQKSDPEKLKNILLQAGIKV